MVPRDLMGHRALGDQWVLLVTLGPLERRVHKDSLEPQVQLEPQALQVSAV